MQATEDQPRTIPEPEARAVPPYLATLETYQGPSERIKGFRRIHDAISNISLVVTVEPIIVLGELYDEYHTNGKSEVFLEHARYIWNALDGENNALIVRRLFPDEKGEAQEGPRSGNVNSLGTLVEEMEKFFLYHRQHYQNTAVLPEIMVHRLVDAANPPFLKDPFLPYASGDVTPISSHRFQVRATFGADESVQGYPADMWEVSFEPGAGVKVAQKRLARKAESKIPSAGQYQTFSIPDAFADKPALSSIQVLTLAQAAKEMTGLYGPHRLEFDGTKKDGQHVFAIIEAAPFEIRKITPEVLKEFTESFTLPALVLTGENDMQTISRPGKTIVHVDPRFFQGNEQREMLNRLAIEAKEREIKLVALASGNIATQHAVRVLIDTKHVVLFVEEEEFSPGEEIRIYPIKKNGAVQDISWERVDPIVPHERIRGRGIERIGGKARGLRELERHGFMVPPYVVIETSLFRQLLEKYDPEDMVASLENVFEPSAIQAITAPIQRRIREHDGKFLPNLESVLASIGGENISVRSSATCEDDQRSSFAGIFKTYLQISPQLTRASIKDVLTSALDPEAIKLARVSGIKPKDIKMAVVLQRMVNARAAGTIFTIDAAARRNDALRIEATKGLGVGIVDGTAKSLLSQQINRKTGQILSSNSVYAREELLSTSEIRQLTKIGLEVEEKFQEGPQDIEWAIDQNGDIFLLQARPLTNIK